MASGRDDLARIAALHDQRRPLPNRRGGVSTELHAGKKQRIAGEGLEAATQIGDVVIAEHHVHVAGGVHECLRVEHPPQPRDETTIDGSSEIALR